MMQVVFQNSLPALKIYNLRPYSVNPNDSVDVVTFVAQVLYLVKKLHNDNITMPTLSLRIIGTTLHVYRFLVLVVNFGITATETRCV